MDIIDGHAHACGMLIDTEGVCKYRKDNHVDRVLLCAGEPGSKKIYKLPNLAKVFQSSRLIYINNAFTSLIIRISKMNEYIDQGNEKVALMAEEYPEYIMNTYWINPIEEDCMNKMEDFRSRHSFFMLKLHQCWTNFDIQDERVHSVIRWADQNRIPIFIHLKTKDQVHGFITLTKEFPNVTFILAHLIGIEEFDKTIGNNVYADLSCPLLHSVRMLQRAYDIFGPERLILGSDAPYGDDNLRLAMNQMHEAGLSESEIELICGKNLLQVLGSL